MELARIEIQGFRRFQRKSVLRISGKVTALVGPNEAGKSSLLEAVSLLNDDEPISPEAISRSAPEDQCLIRAYFLLDTDELKSIGHSGPRWFFVQKAGDGKRRYGFEPTLPERDTQLREKLYSDLLSIGSKPDIVDEISVEDETLVDDAEHLLKELQESQETVSLDKKQKLKDISSRLTNIIGSTSNKYLSKFEQQFNLLIKAENAPTPFQTAYLAVEERIPDFLLFDDEQRELASDYQISDLENEPPSALINLLSLAGVEVKNLLRVMQRRVNADITTLEHLANRELEKQFGELWGQSGVNVSLRISPDLFAI